MGDVSLPNEVMQTIFRNLGNRGIQSRRVSRQFRDNYDAVGVLPKKVDLPLIIELVENDDAAQLNAIHSAGLFVPTPRLFNHCIWTHKRKIVHWLLTVGMKADQKEFEDALLAGDVDIVNLIAGSVRPPPSPIYYMQASNSLPVLQWLHARGNPFDHEDRGLIMAVQSEGNVNVLEWWRSVGLDVDMDADVRFSPTLRRYSGDSLEYSDSE